MIKIKYFFCRRASLEFSESRLDKFTKKLLTFVMPPKYIFSITVEHMFNYIVGIEVLEGDEYV